MEENTINLPTTPSLAQALTRAEIDQQIATAHAYPRSLERVLRNVTSLATITKTAAEKCVYALPRGGKPIMGPSVRLAEIVASQWGNCRVGARVVFVDRQEMYVEAEGVFHDLETNTATTSRVRRRISDKNGRLLSDDMILVTGNAACAIAKRNAIFGGIPEAIWVEAYEAAVETMRGTSKTLVERRGDAFRGMAAFGIDASAIFAILGVKGEREIGLDELATLRAIYSALRNGETSVEDVLAGANVPPPGERNEAAKRQRAAAAAPKKETERPEPREEAPRDEKAERSPEQPTDLPPPDDDRAKFEKIRDIIMDELVDGLPVADARNFYSATIAEMAEAAPALAEEVEAAFREREDQSVSEDEDEEQ